MKSLNSQFDKAMLDAFDRYGEILDASYAHRTQQAKLQILISNYRHKLILIEHVLDQLADDQFKDGMEAEFFFCRCADDIFNRNIANKDLRLTLPSDVFERMKILHPLWGESWFTK